MYAELQHAKKIYIYIKDVNPLVHALPTLGTHIFGAPCNKSKQIRRGYASDEDSDYEVPSPSL